MATVAETIRDLASDILRTLVDVGHDAYIRVSASAVSGRIGVSIHAAPSLTGLLYGHGGRTRAALEHVLSATALGLGAGGADVDISEAGRDPGYSVPHASDDCDVLGFVLRLARCVSGHRHADVGCVDDGEERSRRVLLITCPESLRGRLMGPRGATVQSIQVLAAAYARAHQCAPPIVRIQRDVFGLQPSRDARALHNVPVTHLRRRRSAR